MTHPSTQQIQRYCRGAVDTATLKDIEAHLNDCHQCTQRVSDIVRSHILRDLARHSGSAVLR